MSLSKRALIVKFGQIGDVIMAIPAVRALYENGFEIDWVCGRAVRPLLESYSWIRLVPIDDHAIFGASLVDRVANVARLWAKVVPRRYDLCATLYYDSRFRLLSMPIRAKQKLSLSSTARNRTLLAGRHHTDEYFRLLLGMEDSCRDHSLSPVAPDRLPPSPLPERLAPTRVAIVPGGTSNVLGQQVLRRWPVESYVTLTKQLNQRGWEVVLFGGLEDVWVRPYFQGIPVTDWIGRLSLPEVISACNACDAVVTHDTGPLHLAGLSSACLLGIFGPTDPATRVPRRPFSVGIWGGQGFACRPCYDGRNFAPCTFNGCMHQVSAEMVLGVLNRLLSERSQNKISHWQVLVPEENLIGRDESATFQPGTKISGA